jgi:hypothetical protein
MASKPITNDRLYEAINSTRLELKGDITDLRRQFETLEAGRLTRAEGNINQLGLDLQKTVNNLNASIEDVKQQGGNLSAKAAIIGTIIVIILTGFSAALFYKLIVKQ